MGVELEERTLFSWFLTTNVCFFDNMGTEL